MSISDEMAKKHSSNFAGATYGAHPQHNYASYGANGSAVRSNYGANANSGSIFSIPNYARNTTTQKAQFNERSEFAQNVIKGASVGGVFGYAASVASSGQGVAATFLAGKGAVLLGVTGTGSSLLATTALATLGGALTFGVGVAGAGVAIAGAKYLLKKFNEHSESSRRSVELSVDDSRTKSRVLSQKEQLEQVRSEKYNQMIDKAMKIGDHDERNDALSKIAKLEMPAGGKEKFYDSIVKHSILSTTKIGDKVDKSAVKTHISDFMTKNEMSAIDKFSAQNRIGLIPKVDGKLLKQGREDFVLGKRNELLNSWGTVLKKVDQKIEKSADNQQAQGSNNIDQKIKKIDDQLSDLRAIGNQAKELGQNITRPQNGKIDSQEAKEYFKKQADNAHARVAGIEKEIKDLDKNDPQHAEKLSALEAQKDAAQTASYNIQAARFGVVDPAAIEKSTAAKVTKGIYTQEVADKFKANMIDNAKKLETGGLMKEKNGTYTFVDDKAREIVAKNADLPYEELAQKNIEAYKDVQQEPKQNLEIKRDVQDMQPEIKVPEECQKQELTREDAHEKVKEVGEQKEGKEQNQEADQNQEKTEKSSWLRDTVARAEQSPNVERGL